MKCSRAMLAVALMVVGLSGCKMCLNPFDYCSPVSDANGCQDCAFGARYDSIFAPQQGSPPAVQAGPTMAPVEPSEPAASTADRRSSPLDDIMEEGATR